MIKVLHPGFYSTIQDLGRKDFQHLGVPMSGAMDMHATKMANAILGNDADCAVLEITMLGPKLEFNCETVIIVTGASLSPKINTTIVKNNTLINVNKGDILSFGTPINGLRAYLAVSGGFQSEIVLNSRSMYQSITKASSLNKGDEIKIHTKSHISKKYSAIKMDSNYLNNHVISVYKGPEFHLINNEQINKLFNQEFTVSKENNRMAYQFQELVTNNLKDIITSLVLPGTVQLTPFGKLIVLMRDCQTTGGYPRVLQLKESSINLLSQKKVGDKIKFKLKTH